METITKQLTAEQIEEIKSAIETCEKYKNSFMWNPSMRAQARRCKEQNFYDKNPDIEIETEDGLLEVIFEYRETCSNIYFSKVIKLNGEKKTLATLRKYVK